MKREFFPLSPQLYSQLADNAWVNPDNTIGVEFAKQKWIVEGGAGRHDTTDPTREPRIDVYGVPMSLVSMWRPARTIENERGSFPIIRYGECRLPINVVRKAGFWEKPDFAPAYERYRSE